MKLLLLLLKLLLHARLVLLAMVATGCCAVPTRQEGRQDERDHQREARTEHRYDVNPRSCENANTATSTGVATGGYGNSKCTCNR